VIICGRRDHLAQLRDCTVLVLLPFFHFSQACLPPTLLFPGSLSTRALLLATTLRPSKIYQHTSHSEWQLLALYPSASTITSIPQGLFASSHVRLTTTSGNQGNCSCVAFEVQVSFLWITSDQSVCSPKIVMMPIRRTISASS
jgi:hypothetical protein